MQKVSIITVNLNNREGLEKTIKTVISQTFKDYEFIIIDGASTDGSVEIIGKYKDYISYFVSEPDKGIYNAMNKGINIAKGKYLHFLNSGDIYATEKVLEQTFEKDSEKGFICGNYIFNYGGNLVHFDNNRNRDWSFSLYEIYADGVCHQAFFIRKEMFLKYGYYNESLKIVADFDHFYKSIAIHQEQVQYVDVDIVIYDTNGFSSNVGGIATFKEKRKAIEVELPESTYKRIEHLQYLERNGYITEFVLSKKWIHTLFKVFNKICIGLQLTKVE